MIEIDRAPRETAQFQLDINEADWPEFSVLPGIGETLARRIVESRAADGRFADSKSCAASAASAPKRWTASSPFSDRCPKPATCRAVMAYLRSSRRGGDPVSFLMGLPAIGPNRTIHPLPLPAIGTASDVTHALSTCQPVSARRRSAAGHCRLGRRASARAASSRC